METRHEKDSMTFPNFNHGYCDNCYQPIEGESVSFNSYIDLKDGRTIKTDRLYCEDCIEEVIAFRHLIRNVAEMTAEVVHRHNQDIYYKVYNRTNFG